MQLAGVAVVHSAGRAQTYGADDVRFHCGDAFEEELSRDSELLLLRLPMALVDAQLPGARTLPGQRLGAAEPLTRLIRSALVGCWEAGPTLTPAQQDALLKSLIGLLGVPRIEAVPSGSDRIRQRVQDAVNCVDLNLFDPAFGAPALAGCLHISRRRLDELFVGALGKPVAPYIWERRLHYAGEVLRDRAQQHRTITDVALAHGFGDVAHFARAFKRRFGVTARDWRASACRSN
ncbi:MAG: helix-turn-helix domain-containing protein [Gammaproteobacteria bacterium]|nr:helix-turn-helix domain-containing protein [Gammaproteobacteria bacterium]